MTTGAENQAQKGAGRGFKYKGKGEETEAGETCYGDKAW